MWEKRFYKFFRIADFFYLTIGLIPYDKHVGKKPNPLVKIIFYFCLINLNLHFLGEFIYAGLAFNSGNFVEGTMTLSYIGFVAVSNFKMFAARWKKSALTEFVGNLLEIFPKTREQQQQYQLERYSRDCTITTTAFALLYMVLIWTYNLFSVLEYLIYELLLKVRVVDLTLPYLAYIPWDYKNNWTFYLLYASQVVGGYQSTAGYIGSDLLMGATGTNIIMHYDYLTRTIDTYKLKRDPEANVKFLADVVRYHEKILSLSEMMNHVFGVSLLFNFVSSTGILCFVGFQVTVGQDSNALIRPILFLLSSMMQIYLICHYGEELIFASENVAAAVYKHEWTRADVRYKKMMVLITRRAQKPATLQATSFLKVSRSTMTDILQVSYKFFALLRTMYAQ